MSTKLQCLACEQLYQFKRDNPPWPRCAACQGELAPPIEELEVLEDLTATDDNALLTLSDRDPLAPKNPHAAGGPLAGKPSPYLNPASVTRSGLPVVAWIGIGGGVVALLLMAVVVVVVLALRGLGSPEVAQVPMPPVNVPQFQPPAPVPTRTTPTTPVVPNGNPFTTPAPPAVPSPPPKPTTPENNLPNSASNDGKKTGTIRAGAGRSQEGFTGAQDFQPRTPWNVTPDPAEPYELPEAERPIDIDFKSRVDQLVFPNRPSPYFAAANDDYRNPEIRIFDWRTGRSGRKFPGKLHRTESLSALSADGEHMTTVLSKGGDTAIVIVETKTGKAIHTIGIEDRSSVKALAFAGPNRFLAIVHSSSEKDKNRMGVWT
ncbi:MAG TPA: hypothetical protein VL096_00510, partial [Pirellulaceae bacterium]|nr:hypothetical protein [Pirellulaceae bacterium]